MCHCWLVQQGSGPLRRVAHCVQEFGFAGDDAAGAHHTFQKHGRDLGAVLGQHFFKGRRVVVVGHERQRARLVERPAFELGQRYFSTELCGEDKHLDVPDRAHDLDGRRELLDRCDSAWEIIE